MPVARGGSKTSRQAFLVVIAGLIGCIGMIFLTVQILGQAEKGELKVAVDRIFRAGDADSMAEAIGENGPLLVPDVAGGDRDMILQHIGDDPETGWFAFAARPASATRDCIVQWQPDSEDFADSCDGTVYAANGEGLPQYEVEINAANELSVDLNTQTN